MTNFAGKRVLALESRRAAEIAALIATYGGVPVSAPSMREIPLESNTEAIRFTSELLRGGFDMAIFLTGVGTRALTAVVETVAPRAEFIAALGKVRIAARGPKPAAALRDLGVAIHITAPEPNTWRELLAAVDQDFPAHSLRGLRVAVQEYGTASVELLAALRDRGAIVTAVPIYRWALPENVEPLRSAIRSLASGEISVVLFTTSIQIAHLFQVADEMHMTEPLQEGLRKCVIASIGPTTSEELQERGLPVDLQASHPKMGILVKEAGEGCVELLRRK